MEELIEPDELGTGIKGKRGELTVIGELLRHGLQVYLPVVDIGIDCVVDIGKGNYREIQIKYRENVPTFNARIDRPRDSFFIVCWLNDRGRNDFWTIPSTVYYKLGKPSKIKGRDYIQLHIGNVGSINYNKLAEYHYNFGRLLLGASSEVKKAFKTASNRVEGEHFKQPDFENKILSILLESSIPLSTMEIIKKVKEKMESQFSHADLEISSGRTRWENTARFAIYQGLKKRGLIEAKIKNRWVITSKGRQEISLLENEAE